MGPSDGRPGDEDRQELLPGWSSLVMLLTVFALLAAVTLFAILSKDDAPLTGEEGGLRAYGPADFPEIGFGAPLSETLQKAAREGRTGDFNVPPPPFSDEFIFPCSGCHEDVEPNPEPRELAFHGEIELDHGSDERWCFDCHDTENRDRLRLASGEQLGFDESYRLCGQCHGTIYRDWRAGIHGRRLGYWNGAKSYLLCAHCHNPHAPAFEPMTPLPPPVRPQLLRTAATASGPPPESEDEEAP